MIQPSKSLFHLTRRNNVQVVSVDFHPTVANILCSSDSNGVIAIWDVNQRVMLKHFKVSFTHACTLVLFGRVKCLRLSKYFIIHPCREVEVTLDSSLDLGGF